MVTLSPPRPPSRREGGGRLALVAALAALVGAVGCAGYESRVVGALEALDRGQPDQAVAELNEEMSLDGSDQLPADMRTDDALLVLERGTIQLWRSDYSHATRDLGAADKGIELLDMSRDAADDLGKYLFSDDIGAYRAPAYEKLMINTMGLVGYLAQRKLEDAKVEARRLAIVQKYLKDNDEDTTMLGVASYLAGFAFEKAGNLDEALLFYEEALEEDDFETLRDPLRVLTRGEPRTPNVKELVGASGPLDSVAQTGECDVLVLVSFGRVPAKEPRRIPIGLALTIASGALSPNDHARANELAAKGLVTWVNYPALGPSRGSFGRASVVVDGQAVGLEEALDVEAEVRKAFAEQEPTIVVSAITRMLTRVAVGEAAHAAGRAGDGRGSAGGTIGLLAGLAASAAMTAADTPDTRSWSTLPARISIARFRVKAGRHSLRLQARGVTKDVVIDAAPGGWAFVNLTALR
ncbi:MAG: hypothetical protein JNL21_28780 [Myxococcales bacterium]|nr:hypothetical protein [Myxococcales bacterium]